MSLRVPRAGAGDAPLPAPGALRRGWANGTTAFRDPAFRRVWLASVAFAFAQWMERTAVGWLVLDTTGSIFLTALAWAIRTAPGTLLGPVAGALADRMSRPHLLAGAAAGKAGAMAVIALLAAADAPSGAVLALVAVGGAAMTLHISALQPLIHDIAGPRRAMSAIAINSFGQRAVGAIGAAAAGGLIVATSAEAAFLGAAGLFALAGIGFALVRVPPRAQAAGARFLRDLWDGLRLITSIRLVALLLALMVITENLGFAVNAVLPVVAADVLDVGAGGLGLLGTAIGIGSLLGTAGLAFLGDYRYKGRLLVGVVAGFGGLLLALAASEVFAVSLVVAAGLGAAMAAVDALEWILLQAHVPDAYRGRAIGAWNVAIGLGWLGPILLGLTAAAIGVPEALAVFGVALVGVGVAAAGVGALRRA